MRIAHATIYQPPTSGNWLRTNSISCFLVCLRLLRILVGFYLFFPSFSTRTAAKPKKDAFLLFFLLHINVHIVRLFDHFHFRFNEATKRVCYVCVCNVYVFVCTSRTKRFCVTETAFFKAVVWLRSSVHMYGLWNISSRLFMLVI